MKHPVSTNNPCPFLRTMEAYGFLKGKSEKLTSLSSKIAQAGGATESEGKLSKLTLFIIAFIANGLAPLRLLKSLVSGVDIGSLRNGPLDKKGVGSRIINKDGTVNSEELKRMESYASTMTDPDTKTNELGLKLEHLNKMMDDNFERAKVYRRNIDRKLMDGEWPVLLKVMGKGQGENRYLSVQELKELFIENRFPERILKRFTF